MDFTGTLYNWDDDKGFGFVKSIDGGPDVFVHITAFNTSTVRPKNDDLLLYQVKTTNGKSAAVKVRFADGPKSDKFGLSIFRQRPVGSLIVVGFILFYFIFFPLFIFPPIIFSVVTYFVYSKDKSAARAGTQRTSEKFLHFLSLIGGWPGAFIAQTRFRHKIRKPSFMLVYWLTVILNFAFLYFSKIRFLLNS